MNIQMTLDKFHMLNEVKTLFVGLSGGADSVALLHALIKPCKKAGILLKAVHIHHGLRTASDEEEAVVTKWCDLLGIECLTHHVDVKKRMKEGYGLEEAARLARYEVFERYLQTPGSKFALGHHKDDQAETVLLNLFRGAGLRGLGGIHYVRDAYIRPLLDITREEIEAYCLAHKLPYVHDESNDVLHHRRNVIRHEILPFIENKLGYRLGERIADTAEMLRDDEALFDVLIQEHFGMVVSHQESRCIELDIQGIVHEPVAMQRRLLRYAIEVITGNTRDLTMKHVHSMIDLCYGQTGKKVNLKNEITVRRSYNRLIIRRGMENESQAPIQTTIHLEGLNNEESLKIGDFRVDLIHDFAWDQFPKNIYTKWIDYDKIRGNLVVRQRMNGDFIRIGEHLGKKKVKDVFIDRKVPQEERQKAILIADGDEILWIVGYRMNDAYKVTANTKTVLQLEYIGGQSS